MKKILTYFLFTLVGCQLIDAADKTEVNGKVFDKEDNIAVSFADVVAYAIGDTSNKIKDAALTDDKGLFSLSLLPGSYNIVVEYLGYKKLTKKINISADKSTYEIGTLYLKQDIQTLKTTVIKAQAIAVQTKGDTVEYNAQSFKVAEGSMLETLVKKLPGATVSSDGKITVNGKEIKKILVDGKEFFSDDPSVAMKNLPSNMIEKIKAYDKKSDEARLTGIDDGEDEAVLDLKVKKEMKHGWFGNLQAGLGATPFHHDLSAMLNRFDNDQNISIIGSSNDINSRGFSEKGGGMRGPQTSGAGITQSSMAGINYIKDKSKVKFGGNARYGYNDNDAKREASTEHFQQEGSTYSTDTSRNHRKNHDINVDFQLEWKMDSMSTLIFRPNLTYSKTKIDNTQRSRSLSSLLRETNYSKSSSNSEGDNLNAGGMLRYFRKLNNKGRNFSLSAKVDYGYSESDAYTKSNTIFHLYDDDEDETPTDSLLKLDRHTDNSSHNLTYRLSGSYTEPLSTHHFLQFRYTYQQRKTESESYVYDQNVVGNDYIDSLSSKVNNTYDTHEMELNLQGRYTKVMYKAGFNVSPQRTDNETSVGPNAGRDLKQTVWNYAPNLMLRYMASKRNTLTFRYRGQSSAPDVKYLQEVIDQTDPLNMQYGNPDLKPSYTNNLMLRYNNYISSKQSNIAVNATFKNTLNAITNKIVYDNTTGARKTYATNVNGNWNTSGFVSYLTPIGDKGFRFNTTSQASYENSVGYASSMKYMDHKSITKNLGLGEKLTGTYQTDSFDVSLNAGVNYAGAHNNLNEDINQKTYDWAFGANTDITLPWDIQFSTDITFKLYHGYDDQFKTNEWLWNAQASKTFLKSKAATVRVKVFDILQQQSSLTRTVTSNSICDADYNNLGSYFMVYFTYKFNTLGKNAGNSENRPHFGPDGGGRGGHGGPGFGGPGFGGPGGPGPGGFDFGEGGPRRRERFNEQDKAQSDTTKSAHKRDGQLRSQKNRENANADSSKQKEGEQDGDRPAPPEEGERPTPPEDGEHPAPPMDGDRPMPPMGGDGPMGGGMPPF